MSYRHVASVLLASAISAFGMPVEPPPAQLQVAPPEAAKPRLDGKTAADYLLEVNVASVPKGSAVLWDVYYKDPKNGMFYAEGSAQTRVIKTEQAFLIAGPAGTYRVKCRLVKGEDSTELVWEGTIGKGPAPVPPTPPNPPVPLPDGKFGLIKVSRDSLALVNDPPKMATAKAIASNTRGVASAVAAGGMPDPSLSVNNAKFVLDEWSKVLNAAVADNKGSVDQWFKWGDPVAKVFFAAANSGRLKTKADWVDALNEIADGLNP